MQLFLPFQKSNNKAKSEDEKASMKPTRIIDKRMLWNIIDLSYCIVACFDHIYYQFGLSDVPKIILQAKNFMVI